MCAFHRDEICGCKKPPPVFSDDAERFRQKNHRVLHRRIARLGALVLQWLPTIITFDRRWLAYPGPDQQKCSDVGQITAEVNQETQHRLWYSPLIIKVIPELFQRVYTSVYIPGHKDLEFRDWDRFSGERPRSHTAWRPLHVVG